MYKYNKQKHEVVGTNMEKPNPDDFIDGLGFFMRASYRNAYINYEASLKSYPVQGEVKWLDGQSLEEDEDYELLQDCNLPNCNCHCKNCCESQTYTAYPLQQAESEDDLWAKLWTEIEIWYGDIQKKETFAQFDQRQKQHFQLTRKQL